MIFGIFPTAAASSAPKLLKKESSPPAHTLYVEIDNSITVSGKKVEPVSGIYIPPTFNIARPFELIVYLHGHKGKHPGNNVGIDGYWDGSRFPFFALREEVNAGRRNVVFAMPALGAKSQAGNLVQPGGFDRYIEAVLSGLGAHAGQKTGGIPQPQSIILCAHSGGGTPMRRIVQLKDRYAQQVSECWGFDSLYGGVSEWTTWARKHPEKKLFVYYLGSTEENSKSLRARKLSNVWVSRSSKGHFWVPKLHLKERIEQIGQSNSKQKEMEFEMEFEAAVAAPEPKQVGSIEFAPLPPGGTRVFWPLKSSDPRRNEINYISTAGKNVSSNPGRRFLADRSGGRYHVGVDLFAKEGDPVIACEDGRIMSFYHFYRGTYALFVDHGRMVINYSEVSAKSLEAFGIIVKRPKQAFNNLNIPVKAGQQIGTVGKMYHSSMLHFETYRPGTTSNKRWMKGGKPPRELLNPTKYLLFLRNNSGNMASAPATASLNPTASSPVNKEPLSKKLVSIVPVKSFYLLSTIAKLEELLRQSRDENKITDILFYAIHRDAPQKLEKTDPRAKYWAQVKQQVGNVMQGRQATPVQSPAGIQTAPIHASGTGDIDWAKTSLTSRRQYVMTRLIRDYNFPPNGAAGIVGNLQSESNIIPNKVEGSKNGPMYAPTIKGYDPVLKVYSAGPFKTFTVDEIMNRNLKQFYGPLKPGIGLAQWTSSGRRKGLFEHVYNGRKGGAILFDMDAQIDYLVAEMKRSFKTLYNDLMRRDISTVNASDAVLSKFEKPKSILYPIPGGKSLVIKRQGNPPVIPLESIKKALVVYDNRARQSEEALVAYRQKV